MTRKWTIGFRGHTVTLKATDRELQAIGCGLSSVSHTFTARAECKVCEQEIHFDGVTVWGELHEKRCSAP